MNVRHWLAGLPIPLAILVSCRLDRLVTAPPDSPGGGSTVVRLEFSRQPETATAGDAMAPIEVVARDAEGNRITGFNGRVALAIATGPPGATLTGNREVAAGAGLAMFGDVHIALAGGGYRLVATAEGAASATSAVFVVQPGPPHTLTYSVQPSDSRLLAAIQPPVRVSLWDRHGNKATTFTGLVTIRLGRDGSLLGNATLAPSGTQRFAIGGDAEFENVRIDQPGSGYTLIASVTDLAGVESAAFDVTLLQGVSVETWTQRWMH